MVRAMLVRHGLLPTDGAARTMALRRPRPRRGASDA